MERKYTLFIIIILGGLVSIVLYLKLQNNKINIISIGDSYSKGLYNEYLMNYYKPTNRLENYNLDYSIPGLKSEQLLKIITKNELSNTISIKQAISKSDIVIIFIGIEELTENGNVNVYIYNMDKIVENIKKINNKDIFLIGLPEQDKKIKDINNWIEKIAKKYKIQYIDIESLNLTNIQDSQSQEKIFEKIIDNL